MKGLIEPAELATRVAEVVEQRLPLLGDGAVVADDLDLPERGEEVFLRNWIPMMTKRCKLARRLQSHLTRHHQKYLSTSTKSGRTSIFVLGNILSGEGNSCLRLQLKLPKLERNVSLM